MAEGPKQQESSKNLLNELEDGWDAPPSSEGDEVSTRELDALAKEIDSGWLDELFPDEEEEEEEEEEEPEPELPDERLDPVAYAAAKKARDERAARRKERKKAKAEAKRAKRKARAEAIQKARKQKARKAKPPQAKPAAPPQRPRREAKEKTGTEIQDDDETDATEDAPVALKTKSKVKSPTVDKRTISSIKLLAIVLLVLVGAAALAAALMK